MRDTLERFGGAVVVGLIALLFLWLAAPYLTRSRPEDSAPERVGVPHFSTPGGYYDDDLPLVLRATVPGAVVRYTLDGSLPTVDKGTVYTRPIRLSAEPPTVAVVRARVELPDTEPGATVSESYFMGVEAALPLLSLVIDPEDMWGDERGIYTHPQGRGREWERPVDLTFVDVDRSRGFQVTAGARIHGEWSRRFDKKSFRFYFRRDYGPARLTYPLFPGSEVATFDRLVLHNGGNDSTQPEVNWTLLRNALVTELAFAMGEDATHTRPVLVFVNGELWGIYQLRERIDEAFLEDHYGVDEADILDSPANEWVGTTIAGDREHWEQLIDFVASHDLTEPGAYAYVRSQVDIDDFIDYTLLQIYSGNADWPEHNVNQFRARRVGGQWQWIVWDNDYSFGLNLYGDVAFEGDIVTLNLVQKLLEDDHVATDGEDTLLFRRLFENSDFRQRFLLRAAELLNTTFAAESVVPRIDALAEALAPDIDYEVARWGSSVNWALSVEGMRDYARRRPAAVREQIVTTFGLPGTTDLSFAPPIQGKGGVAVNGRVLEVLPWTGRYFRGTHLEVQAVPAPGYAFAGWENIESVSPTPVLPVAEARTLTPRFLPLDPALPRVGDVTLTAYVVDDDTSIDGDWIEVRVEHCGGMDLRGWRFTDNDHKSATGEGSLILADAPALAAVPCGTLLRIVATRTAENDARFPEDDLAAWDRRMLIYLGNDHLFKGSDGWFDLQTEDNLAILAPGPSPAYSDDVGIAFASGHPEVTPASFGVLTDGVRGTPLPLVP
jgi:hypothetical protein